MTSAYEAHETLKAYEVNQVESTVDADAPVDSYPGDSYDTSLLYLYGDHAARYVWKWDVYLFTFALHIFYTNLIAIDVAIFIFVGASMFKIRNPGRKILELEQNEDDWFQNVLCFSRLAGLYVVGYKIVNCGMQTTFAETWHSETSYFYLPIDEMNDVSSFSIFPLGENY